MRLQKQISQWLMDWFEWLGDCQLSDRAHPFADTRADEAAPAGLAARTGRS